MTISAQRNSRATEVKGRDMNIKIKRVYEHPAKDDGMRILVDRLGERGSVAERCGSQYRTAKVVCS